jgi:PhnB protein
MSELNAAELYREASLAPMLSVRGGLRALEFYQKAFGARVLFQAGEVSGVVIAKLAIGNAEFWIADEEPEFGNAGPETLGGTTMRMIVVLDDPHAAFECAVAAGAAVLCPVTDEDYGWRIGRLRDPFGHVWEIGKPLNEDA